MQHRARTDEEKREARAEETVHRVCMDYGYLSRQDEEEGRNPMLLLVDETTGDRFARLVGKKGLGENREQMWVVKDASDELRAWGHPGGAEHRLILKCDGEPALVAFRDALARYHGGVCVCPRPRPVAKAKATAWPRWVSEWSGSSCAFSRGR